MRNSTPTAGTDTSITRACAQFAAQVRPIFPMEALAVVLIEPDGDTSRVVYSWTDTKTAWTSAAVRVETITGPQREG